MRCPRITLPARGRARAAVLATACLLLLAGGGAVGRLTAPGDPELRPARAVQEVPSPRAEPYIELPAIRGVRR